MNNNCLCLEKCSTFTLFCVHWKAVKAKTTFTICDLKWAQSLFSNQSNYHYKDQTQRNILSITYFAQIVTSMKKNLKESVFHAPDRQQAKIVRPRWSA